MRRPTTRRRINKVVVQNSSFQDNNNALNFTQFQAADADLQGAEQHDRQREQDRFVRSQRHLPRHQRLLLRDVDGRDAQWPHRQQHDRQCRRQLLWLLAGQRHPGAHAKPDDWRRADRQHNTIRQCPQGRGIEVTGMSLNGGVGLDATVTNNNVNPQEPHRVPIGRHLAGGRRHGHGRNAADRHPRQHGPRGGVV